jgi:hypothetical protein
VSDAADQPSSTPDPAELQARFEAEIAVAGITVSGDDRAPLYGMWTALQPIRARLRNASLAIEEEPSFTQKPAQLGAGITLAGVLVSGQATVDDKPAGGQP